MFFALLNTCVTRVGVDRVLVTVQQFSHLCHVCNIGRGAVDLVHQA
jgi:hypothetical protein